VERRDFVKLKCREGRSVGSPQALMLMIERGVAVGGLEVEGGLFLEATEQNLTERDLTERDLTERERDLEGGWGGDLERETSERSALRGLERERACGIL